METKKIIDYAEFIVGLKKDIDYDQFWSEMENQTSGIPNIPDRPVKIANERVGSKRLCHYLLTDEEVKELRKDPRVITVEIPPRKRNDIKIGRDISQPGNFDKNIDNQEGNYTNWGLKRVISATNNYGDQLTAEDTYDYILDGTGVDVVISDSGIEINHPEFLDKDGNTRVQQIDWYENSGLYHTQLLNYKSDQFNYITFTPLGYFAFKNPITSYGIQNRDYNNLLNSLILGVLEDIPGVQNEGAAKIIYGDPNDLINRKYSVFKYVGRVDYTHPDTEESLVWQVRFTDSNSIEILVLRHDKPLEAIWQLNRLEDRDSNIELSAFKDLGLVNGVTPKSIVLTLSNEGRWLIHGDINTSYHVELNNDVWEVVEGVATPLGQELLFWKAEWNDPWNPASEPFIGWNVGFYHFDFFIPYYYKQTTNFYQDMYGHGTHVAATVAGKTYGWAKNANIYSMKVDGLQGSADSLGIPMEDCFDLIKIWHTNKPIDPQTGFKRPTIVNMSWGYRTSVYSEFGLYLIEQGEYRGVPWADTPPDNVPHPEYGMIGDVIPVRISSVDIDVEELVDAGVHVVISAGNSSYKHDLVSGVDYNNFFIKPFIFTDPSTIYYHRGQSPYNDGAIIVGATSYLVHDVNTDQKTQFSDTGPGVDIYAPGNYIMSATSNVNEFGEQSGAYYPDNRWKQSNISGTSMAAPQVAGVGALLLQLYPTATPGQLKSYILANSTSVLYSTGLDNDYENLRSLNGGVPRMLYLKFGTDQSFNSNVGSSGIIITKK